MQSRLFKLLDETRKQNFELSEKVEFLEKELELERKILGDLLDRYGDLYQKYEHEKKLTDTLVKHSHILFQKLESMQKVRMVLPNIKEVIVDPNQVAHKPTQAELEDIFKESIVHGKKD